jgi:hypothetical protein
MRPFVQIRPVDLGTRLGKDDFLYFVDYLVIKFDLKE